MKRSLRSALGSVRSCPANPTCSNANVQKVRSSKSDNKISKYFSATSVLDDFDSPYRDNLTEQKPILNDSTSEDGEFKTPKIMKNRPKTTKPIVKKNAKKTAKKSKVRQTTLTKMIEEQLSCTDTNPEHLQMAIQLSKSEQISENSNAGDWTENSVDLSSTQCKIANIRATLEQFGFRSSKRVADNNFESTRRPKNSRYRFVKPILFLRTENERLNRISEKISSITSETIQSSCDSRNLVYFLSSPYLQSLQYFGDNIFRRNNDETSNKANFYVTELNLPRSESKCGSLLKDWGTILGREQTPPREIKPKALETIPKEIEHKTEKLETQLERSSCVSPDLFDSDAENDCEIKKINESIQDSLSRSLDMIKRFKNSQDEFSRDTTIFGGIEHFESFSEDVETLSVTLSQQYNEKFAVSDADSDTSDVSRNGERLSSQIDRDITVEFTQDKTSLNPAHSSVEANNLDNFHETKSENYEEQLRSIEDTLECVGKENIIESVSCKKDDLARSFLHRKSNEDTVESLSGRNFIEGELNAEDVLPKATKFKYKSRKVLNSTPSTQSSDESKNLDHLYEMEDKNYKEQLNRNEDTLEYLKKTGSSKNESNKQENESNVTKIKNKRGEVLNITKSFHEPMDFGDLNKTINNIYKDHLKSNEDTFESLSITNLIENELNTEEVVAKATKFKYKSRKVLNSTQSLDESKNLGHLYETEDKNYKEQLNRSVDTLEYLSNKQENESNVLDDLNKTTNNIYKEHLKSNEDTLECLSITNFIENEFNTEKIEPKSTEFNFRSEEVVNISSDESTGLNNLEEIERNNYKEDQNSEGSMDIDSIGREEDRFCGKTAEDTLENLNITEYIEHMLNTQDFSMKATPKVLDLTQSSDESTTDEQRENNHSFIDDLVGKPLQEENLNLVKDYSPKKFKKSISFDCYKTDVIRPTPKKNNIRKSLTFGSPGGKSEREKSQSTSFDEINDEELNYSSLYSTPSKLKWTSTKATVIEVDSDENLQETRIKTPIVHQRIRQLTENQKTPQAKANLDGVSTPENVLIKTTNVTPMPDYDRMNTPTISRELEKIGVKNLKRHRGVQILKHIYESTHPVIDNDLMDDVKIVKKMRNHGSNAWQAKGDFPEIVGSFPDSEDLFFERRQLAKVSSCAVPLHIAWHNLLSCNPDLYENILLYEPLQLEVLYTMLKEQGYKFHIQDLLTFLDKKCITIRTQQNNTQARRRKKTQRKLS